MNELPENFDYDMVEVFCHQAFDHVNPLVALGDDRGGMTSNGNWLSPRKVMLAFLEALEISEEDFREYLSGTGMEEDYG